MKAATGTNVEYGEVVEISIHAAREGGDVTGFTPGTGVYEISIHAAREGGDVCDGIRQATRTISIHAAREGGDEIGV